MFAIKTPGGKRIQLRNINAQQMMLKKGMLLKILWSNVLSRYK